MARKKAGVSLVDVAKLAGVSTATAGRVLGGYGYKSGEKSEKVLSAAKTLGYRPNLLARGLITGKSKTIGVVAGDIQSAFYASIIRGISDVAERNNIGLIITNSDESVAREMSSVRLLIEKQVDGVILSPCSPQGGAHLDALVDAGIAIVQIDRQVENLAADFVGTDNRAGAREAISRLIDLGHRQIAMIGELVHTEWTIERFISAVADQSINSDKLYPSWQRLHGFIEAHLSAELLINPRLIRQVGSYSAEAAERQTQLLLAGDRPSAIFTADGVMTAGAMAAISATQIQLPSELSIICFDDLDWMSFVRPGIDAVAQPRGAMGEAAAQLLLDRIEGSEEATKRIIMAPRLVPRGSVVPPRP